MDSHRGRPLNRLKSLWSEGKAALGAIVTIPSVQVVQVLARSGLDWILIDMEHGAMDAEAVHAMIAATSGTPLVPLVRLASTSAWQAKLPLDLGAFGVCFPMTSTRYAAASAVQAVHYPPRGNRFWGPFYAALHWGLSMQDYVRRADDEIIAVGTIEHGDAIDCIDEVVTTPGLDLLFIGPGDLATSMGHKGDVEHPDVQSVMRRLEQRILQSEVMLGGVARSREQANAMIARGYRAIVIGFDWSLLQSGAIHAFEGISR